MSDPFEATLTAALDDLEEGDSVEIILDRYPDHAAELRMALGAIRNLQTVSPAPTAAAERSSRRRFLEHGAMLKAEQGQQASLPLWRRLFFSFGAAAIALALIAIIVVPASRGAIPGDLLYPVKRGYEGVQLFFASAAGKQELHEQLDNERNRELYEMIDTGRDGFAGYKGTITEMEPGMWTIGDIRAYINEETLLVGEPEVGALVAAHCRVEDGQVYAERIAVIAAPEANDGAGP
jgi:hypothetical protein